MVCGSFKETKAITSSGEAMTQPCNSFLSKKVHPGGWFTRRTIHPFFLGEGQRIRDFFRIFVNYFDFLLLRVLCVLRCLN